MHGLEIAKRKRAGEASPVVLAMAGVDIGIRFERQASSMETGGFASYERPRKKQEKENGHFLQNQVTWQANYVRVGGVGRGGVALPGLVCEQSAEKKPGLQ
jgi:hypothetical protein